MRIELDDLQGPDTVAFLEAHVSQLRALSPPESTHALDLTALRSYDVTFWSASEDGEVVGCAALKRLDDAHAELKSMRTATHRTRRGVAKRLLVHALEEAGAKSFERVSLETGSEEFFAPARSLYAAHGFIPCPPFGDYHPDPLSVFMTRLL